MGLRQFIRRVFAHTQNPSPKANDYAKKTQISRDTLETMPFAKFSLLFRNIQSSKNAEDEIYCWSHYTASEKLIILGEMEKRLYKWLQMPQEPSQEIQIIPIINTTAGYANENNIGLSEIYFQGDYPAQGLQAAATLIHETIHKIQQMNAEVLDSTMNHIFPSNERNIMTQAVKYNHGKYNGKFCIEFEQATYPCDVYITPDFLRENALDSNLRYMYKCQPAEWQAEMIAEHIVHIMCKHIQKASLYEKNQDIGNWQSYVSSDGVISNDNVHVRTQQNQIALEYAKLLINLAEQTNYEVNQEIWKTFAILSINQYAESHHLDSPYAIEELATVTTMPQSLDVIPEYDFIPQSKDSERNEEYEL